MNGSTVLFFIHLLGFHAPPLSVLLAITVRKINSSFCTRKILVSSDSLKFLQFFLFNRWCLFGENWTQYINKDLLITIVFQSSRVFFFFFSNESKYSRNIRYPMIELNSILQKQSHFSKIMEFRIETKRGTKRLPREFLSSIRTLTCSTFNCN